MSDADFQVSVVVVEAGGKLRGELDLYLKAGAPPGSGVNQHDARPIWNQVEGNTQMEAVLDVRQRADPGTALLRPGIWYAGVRGGLRPTNYTLLFNRYDCPLNCSGHGSCDVELHASQRACQCDKG